MKVLVLVLVAAISCNAKINIATTAAVTTIAVNLLTIDQTAKRAVKAWKITKKTAKKVVWK